MAFIELASSEFGCTLMSPRQKFICRYSAAVDTHCQYSDRHERDSEARRNCSSLGNRALDQIAQCGQHPP